MSGGHFDYVQYKFQDVADQLDTCLDRCADPDDAFYHNLSQETRDVIIALSRSVRVNSLILNRVDWLLSGDDSEQSFREYLIEDLAAVDD